MNSLYSSVKKRQINLLSEGIKENTGAGPASHDKETQYRFAAQLTAKRLQTLINNT